MAQKILVFAGCAQSGKSTAAKFVSGMMLKQAGVIDWFEVHDESGDLYINATGQDKDGGTKKVIAKLDLYRQDPEFLQYAAERLFPYSRIYSYATRLKNSCNEVFGLSPENLYGSDEQKNQFTHIKWENLEKVLHILRPSGAGEFVTHREFMQYWGTEICRTIDPTCWCEGAFTEIILDGWPNVLIDDCRFEDELDIAKKYEAKVVLLTRNPMKKKHKSEKILELDRSKFDYVIENDGQYSIKEKEKEIVKILETEGWLTAQL